MLLYRYRSTRKVDFVLWGASAVFGILGVLTMTGNVIALGAAFAFALFIFVVAFRSMVRFRLSETIEEEILGGCGITAAQNVARQR